jgi:multidrug resistance efflux pump
MRTLKNGLVIAKRDRFGEHFTLKSVVNSIVTEINTQDGTYFLRGAKMIRNDIDNAKTMLDESEQMLDNAITRYKQKSNELAAVAKKTSGDVRKAADDLASGLLKVEKTANFSNLERYVNLLERAATAMQSLSELEKNGKLEKIAGALK